MKRYNAKNPAQVEEFKEKQRQTMIKNWGEDNASKVPEIQKRKEQTCLKNHGVKYSQQDPEVREKTRQTWQRNWHEDNISRVQEIKDKKAATTMKHYNVDNPFKSNVLKAKAAKTHLNNIGVENPGLIAKNRLGIPTTLIFPDGKEMTTCSNWETIFALYLFYNRIPFKYEPITIYFEYDGKECSYRPDFVSGNKIFELKGARWINELTEAKEDVCLYLGYTYYLIETIDFFEDYVRSLGIDTKGLKEKSKKYREEHDGENYVFKVPKKSVLNKLRKSTVEHKGETIC